MKIEERYESYLSGKLSKKKLRDEILEYVYKKVSMDRFIEPGDFIIDFIPRAENIINKYNSELSSFKHYLNKHIKWLMFSFSKVFIKEKEKSEAYQYHYVAEFKDEMCLIEQPINYNIDITVAKLLSIENGKIIKESSKKRLEIFTLKNSRSLSYEQIITLAPLIERDPEWLFENIRILNDLCSRRIDNRDYLQQRHNRLFIEITRDQKKLLEINSGYEKDILLERMKEKQDRKDKLNQKLKNRNCGPKNEEIAKLLGIPKGTVDSSLFYIKKSLASLLPIEEII